jgi:hypothetical protein
MNTGATRSSRRERSFDISEKVLLRLTEIVQDAIVATGRIVL